MSPRDLLERLLQAVPFPSVHAWRARQYRAAFGTEAGKLVLGDLARFCHAYSSTYDDDPRAAAALEGRRQVWLRIQDYLGTDEPEFKRYSALMQAHEGDAIQRDTRRDLDV